MHPIGALAAYLGVVFAGGGLLAPWLYWLADATPLAGDVSTNPFHRFVSRSLLLVALLGIWPYLRALRMSSWRDVGLGHRRDWLRQAGTGFVLGFLTLGSVGLIALAAGAREWNHATADRIAAALGTAAASALIVGVLEELLFRGTIFGSLRRQGDWIMAIIVSSVVYSLVHFFRKPGFQPWGIRWWSGLRALPDMMLGFLDVTAVVPGFFVLLLVGAILALAYQRNGNLYFSIGLHAGWIFWMKSYGVMTTSREGASQWIWGSAKIVDGWISFVVLLPLLVWLSRSLEPVQPVREYAH
ncbi:MAG: CPBP family intramembrane metalloprotease [Verrucomicrobia subdivision 3 bacterium]|nr:CPBP family intramembrane metalloprotease [Limisphaerales bacterium]